MRHDSGRQLLPSVLMATLALVACASPSADETLVDEFAAESEDALLAALPCGVDTPVCTTSQVRPQCLAAAMEAGFGFEAYQEVNVPATATYASLTVVLKRFFSRSNGNFRVELREFLPGSTSIESSVFLTAATIPGLLLPRSHARVTLHFDSPTTLAPALGATPRYLLLFKVTGGTSLSVGIGCAEGVNDLPGLTAGGHKLLNSGEGHVPQAWRTSTRVLALALGNVASGDGACRTTPGATCDDGNASSGDGCSADCQVESGFTCTNLPSVCTNGDGACAGNSCQNGSTCVAGVNTYTCTCAPGFSGPRCATNIDECSPNPCTNGGTCTDGINAFTCACPSGFTGATCATPYTPVATASTTTADGTALTHAFQYYFATFTVTVADQHGHPMTTGGAVVEANHLQYGSPVPSVVTDNHDGTYTVKYLVTIPSYHTTVDVTLGGTAIAGSPFEVDVGGSAYGPNCVITNDLSDPTGIVNTFTFTLNDANGNPVLDFHDRFQAFSTNGYPLIPLAFSQAGPGVANFTFVGQVVGNCETSVQVVNDVNALDVNGSPFLIQFV